MEAQTHMCIAHVRSGSNHLKKNVMGEEAV